MFHFVSIIKILEILIKQIGAKVVQNDGKVIFSSYKMFLFRFEAERALPSLHKILAPKITNDPMNIATEYFFRK
jgi:hypothetical protein